jgi:hypothetical protein
VDVDTTDESPEGSLVYIINELNLWRSITHIFVT